MIFDDIYLYIKLKKINFVLFKYINFHLGIFVFLQYVSLALHYIFAVEAFILYFLITFLYIVKRNFNAISQTNKQILVFKAKSTALSKSSSLDASKYNHIKKKYSEIYKKLFFIGALYTIFAIIFILLKFTINKIRPICATNNYYSIIEFGFERCKSSFPSGHAGMATLYSFFAYLHLVDKFNIKNILLKLGLILSSLMLIILISISRIILALHYPFDLLSGFIIASLIIIATFSIKTNKIYKLFENITILIIEKIIYFKR